jgi:hypothetical protein
MLDSQLTIDYTVERLYCKRPILCLASSKILTPHPPHRPASVHPRLWCGGRTHSLDGEGGGGSIFWKTPDTTLYSTYVRTLWIILSDTSTQVHSTSVAPPPLNSPASNSWHTDRAVQCSDPYKNLSRTKPFFSLVLYLRIYLLLLRLAQSKINFYEKLKFSNYFRGELFLVLINTSSTWCVEEFRINTLK